MTEARPCSAVWWSASGSLELLQRHRKDIPSIRERHRHGSKQPPIKPRGTPTPLWRKANLAVGNAPCAVVWGIAQLSRAQWRLRRDVRARHLIPGSYGNGYTYNNADWTTICPAQLRYADGNRTHIFNPIVRLQIC